MAAGINLSQSLQEKQALARGNFFDKGFFANIAILLVVLAVYGGTYWYLGNLEAQSAALQAEISQKTASLKGEQSSRIIDFQSRLDTISKNLVGQPDSSSLFMELEKTVPSSIRLTEYIYDQPAQEITVSGLTDNLRFVAQQMLAFKKMSGVEKVHAQTVEYNNEGKIEFTLQLTLLPAGPVK